MIELTYERAVELAKEAVAERGAGYVYKPPTEDGSCVYVNNGAPSCLVGEILFRAGVPLSEMEAHNKFASDMLLEELDPQRDVDERTRTFFSDAQFRQDDGLPWGRAVTEAIARVSHMEATGMLGGGEAA